MTRRLDWAPGTPAVGPSAVALGVFDGVHVGHQSLIEATVLEARANGWSSVVATFDRDPDELLRPVEARHLLTLKDRLDAFSGLGVDVALVIPFDESMATRPARSFLDDVLAAACELRSIHVGSGFRFGASASGDLDTLLAWGAEHTVRVHDHPLIRRGAEAVSSTRIRELVSMGAVSSAASLLGRPHRVTGVVGQGRGEGAQLGFPTANVKPLEHTLLPRDGVYVARALLDDGSRWGAAVTVGIPPSFPDAIHPLEAHLVGFEGDLEGSTIVVEFVERLRDLRRFDRREDLIVAIGSDVDRAQEVLSSADVRAATRADEYVGEDGTPLVEDPFALEAATRAVASRLAAEPDYEEYDESWVPVFGPHRMSLLFADGGTGAALLTGPLSDAGIPFVWDPFPPGRAQSVRPDFNWMCTCRPTGLAKREHSFLRDDSHSKEPFHRGDVRARPGPCVIYSLGCQRYPGLRDA
jgi:riboflavin kinase/FMN adenylyltransferase